MKRNSITMRRPTKLAIQIGKLLYPERTHLPVTRGDCASVPRPCPYVSCKYNLYLDVTRAGSILLNFPDREPWDMPPDRSCALDVADRGPQTLQAVGEAIGFCRERTRQILDDVCDTLDPLQLSDWKK